MQWFVISGILLILLIVIQNGIHWIQAKVLLKKIDDVINERKDLDLNYERDTFLKLTHIAGVTDIPVIYNLDEITVTPSTVRRTFPDNLGQSRKLLIQAIGALRNAFFTSLNPFAWIKFALLLPSYLLGYVGINRESQFAKIINVFWWVIGALFWLFTPYIESYREQFLEFVELLFSQPSD